MAACPSDSFLDAGIQCRTPAGVCDVSEECTGTSAQCPVDAKAPATTVCRGDAGPCDTVEFCTGTGNVCPTDVFAPANSLACAPSRCTGFSAACTTSCNDSSGCADTVRSVCFNNVCATSKVVFVTSTTYPTNLGIDGGDIACATQAADAGLSGRFLPWMATASLYPRNRFTSYNQPYARVDKVVVGANLPDFYDGQLLAPIIRDERGVQISTVFNVLSGVAPSGIVQVNFPSNVSTNYTCANWTSAAATNTGLFGGANSFGQAWTAGSSLPLCSSVPASRLYCFEQ